MRPWQKARQVVRLYGEARRESGCAAFGLWMASLRARQALVSEFGETDTQRLLQAAVRAKVES